MGLERQVTWYAQLDCIVCGHRMGQDGVLISMRLRFCRPCAMRVRDAIEATVGVEV